MSRRGIAALLLLATYLASVATSPAAAQPAPDTGYSVTNPKLLDYFDHRGGARVLGFPISREFDFLGSKVQFFQRTVLQLRPDGSVALLNILDEGLLPYTRINGSTFPAPDPALIQTAPSPADPNYAARAIDLVKANAPDNWEGLKTNFYSTFLNTVAYQEAFPRADADPGLLPLISLEIWGLPTSKPTYDPNNGNFVYLRFQRGIMHFDKSSGLTRGILIGDYLKAVITGQNLPADLETQAQGSRLYRQYSNSMANGVANPSSLPGSNLFGAFEKDGVVVPTPVPTATPAPVPPTATPTPEPTPAVRPDSIAIEGTEWFVEQTTRAKNMLPETIRDVIYKIVEVSDRSRFDIPNRTLYVIEQDAFVPGWRETPDAQTQWYAGWIAHVAVHGEQYWSGRPTAGLEAEREAFTRQKDFIVYHDATEGVFTKLMIRVVNGELPGFGEWAKP